MSETSIPAEKAALQILQQALSILAHWVDLPDKAPKIDNECKAVKQAKDLLSWTENARLQPLRLLFDKVNLCKGQSQIFYWKPQAIPDSTPHIPYPQTEKPDIDSLKPQIKEVIENLTDSDWDNLSLLTLIIEKFGSFISFGEEDVALIDITRSTAAVAGALSFDPDATHLKLVAGDLSGIQNFIYTISSDGALKSLRARSFYLELVTEEVVQQLLAALKLPRTNIIYAGGGNLYILAPNIPEYLTLIKEVRQQFNQWLLEQFQAKVFLALDNLEFPIEEINTYKFADYWSGITKQLGKQKKRKFATQIEQLLKERDSHIPCQVCHRDDLIEDKLRPLKDENSVLVCETCSQMFKLGEKLLKVEAIVRSPQPEVDGNLQTISFELPKTSSLPEAKIYYHLFKHWKPLLKEVNMVLLVNDWTIEHYKTKRLTNSIPLLLGDYAQRMKIEDDSTISVNERVEGQTQNSELEDKYTTISAGKMAEEAKGIKRVGYLRMDVDRLGRIFAKGLDNSQTLPRLSGLSRMMSYFFKVYLNSLAELRNDNLLKPLKEGVEVLKNVRVLEKGDRPNLLFIYAGGDDLFVSGAWNEIVDFGFDVYQCFRAYTGHHPDITLSGGVYIAGAKFPLYQAAIRSGDAEEEAKKNGRDSLGLFDEVFKWDEWLGTEDLAIIDPEIKEYLDSEVQPDLFGVLPLVQKLEGQKLDINYSRSFVQNLLATAQLQEQCLKQAKQKEETVEHQRDIRYFLHLPRIAYTLARLPDRVINHADFKPVRVSLKSPYNAPYFRAIATWLELLNR